MIDYAKAEFGIDGDLDKMALIFESEPMEVKKTHGLMSPQTDSLCSQAKKKEPVFSKHYIFALYDLQRIVFIEFNDADIFAGSDQARDDNKSVAAS